VLKSDDSELSIAAVGRCRVLQPSTKEAMGPIARGRCEATHTSVPIVIETFTIIDRNANRDVASDMERIDQ
jgi:hypothetical protein